MIRIAVILALLLCATHAQARTLYVSLTGSHDTNAPAFSTWATAATNIQAAIDAASDGDTVRIAHGTYTAGAVGSGTYGAINVNKSYLTLQGGRGTLWDADKTILQRSGSGDLNGLVITSGVAGVTVKGLTFIGSTSCIIETKQSVDATLDSIIVRGNTPSYMGVRLGQGATLQNSIVVGNQVAGSDSGVVIYYYLETDMTLRNCIVEANSGVSIYGKELAVGNSIYGWTEPGISYNRGGNITNQTTNSVCRILDIAPASEGVGTNLQWAGVAAYIPRLGSLAQGAGVGYAGIDTAKRGDGGPVLVPAGAEFLGRDSSTNANHGASIGGVTASTNSPFVGGGSAAFDGAIDTEVWFGERQSLNVVSNFTIEVWVAKASNVFERFLSNSSIAGAAAYEIGSNYSNPNQWRLILNSSAVLLGDIAYAPWVHIAVSRSGSQVVMYQNGSPIATATYATAISGHGAVSTRRQNPGSYGSVGFTVSPLSDLRIWNVARTPEEIAANYTNRLTGTEAGLVGYWRLDEPGNVVTAGPFNLRNPLNHPTYMESF